MSSYCCVCESPIRDWESTPSPLVIMVGSGMYEFCADCADNAVVEYGGEEMAPREVRDFSYAEG